MVRGTPWQFDLYLRYKPASGADQYAKYSPKSDFRLDNEHDIPLLLGEIVSDPKNEEDRYRLLLQATAITRLMAQFGDNPMLMAIYVDARYRATRYIVYVDKKDDKKVSKYFNALRISATNVLTRYKSQSSTLISQIKSGADDSYSKSSTLGITSRAQICNLTLAQKMS